MPGMGRKMERKKRSAGFTLVELVVVAGIISILLAFAVPQMMRYVKLSQRAAGRTEAHLLADAVQRYLDDKKEAGDLTMKSIMELLNQIDGFSSGVLGSYIRGGQADARIAALSVDMNEGRLQSVTYESKYYKVRVDIDKDGNRTLEDEQIK